MSSFLNILLHQMKKIFNSPYEVSVLCLQYITPEQAVEMNADQWLVNEICETTKPTGFNDMKNFIQLDRIKSTIRQNTRNIIYKQPLVEVQKPFFIVHPKIFTYYLTFKHFKSFQTALNYNRSKCLLAYFDRIDLLQLLYHKCPNEFTNDPANDFIVCASMAGNIYSLMYLNDIPNMKTTTHAMDFASMYGHLECVKFLHETRKEGCTFGALNGALILGHLSVVKFLCENRTEGFTEMAVDMAMRNGHIDAVFYVLSHQHLKKHTNITRDNNDSTTLEDTTATISSSSSSIENTLDQSIIEE